MLERSSHLRVAAKQAAIEALGGLDFEAGLLQKSLQSTDGRAAAVEWTLTKNVMVWAWWTHLDSNQGPLACEASALTGLSYASTVS